jgi:hypothetical protein
VTDTSHQLAAAFADSDMPDLEQTGVLLRAIRGALEVEGRGPSPVQVALVDALAARFVEHQLPSLAEVEPAEPSEVADALSNETVRQLLAHLLVLLELCDHPIRPRLERRIEQYLGELGVDVPQIDLARDSATDHLVRLRADLLRNSWYTEQTMAGIAAGKLWEYARSKLAYYGVAGDRDVARRWHALADLEPGTWGRTVADFYAAHEFPFPGERHGIYEIGAMHDWIHVLADYTTSPAGEIDVFAFIAATMDDPKGFVQLILTLALFQNATMDTVGGVKVSIARADTLSDPGAVEGLADSLWRAAQCPVDVMGGVDHFALADRPLDELRRQFNIVPKRVPSPGALDLPGVRVQPR